MGDNYDMPRKKRIKLSKKVGVRLDSNLHDAITAEADARSLDVSELLRGILERVLLGTDPFILSGEGMGESQRLETADSS